MIRITFVRIITNIHTCNKKFIFNKDIFWSDSRISISKDQAKEENGKPVLDRMELQLKRSGILNNTFTKKPDLNWSVRNIKNIINQNFEGKYILVFPFCSEKLEKKRWPYYNDLITLLNREYGSRYNIAIAPGPDEIKKAKNFKTNIILNKNLPLNVSELISLIKNASYIISNDTGPAHICAHLNKKGLALFGSHTSPEKVSIGSDNFKSITVDNLKNLNVADVFERIKEELN